MGVGSAFMLVPIVPAMLHTYKSRFQSTDGSSTQAEGVPEEIEDTISGIYQSSWSLGELIGPPTGGFLLERLPRTRELNCVLAPKVCTWAYFASMSVFVVALCIVPIVLLVSLIGVALCDKEAPKAKNGGYDCWVVVGGPDHGSVVSDSGSDAHESLI